MPAATDTSPDRISGNALSSMLVSLPVHFGDPLERVRLTGAATRIAKENQKLLGPNTIAHWLDYVPPIAEQATFRWLSRRRAPNQLINVIVSSVAGPRHRGRIAGAVVDEIYSVGSGGRRSRAEHDGVELRRPTQHLSTLRRPDTQRHPRGNRRDDPRVHRQSARRRAFPRR